MEIIMITVIGICIGYFIGLNLSILTESYMDDWFNFIENLRDKITDKRRAKKSRKQDLEREKHQAEREKHEAETRKKQFYDLPPAVRKWKEENGFKPK